MTFQFINNTVVFLLMKYVKYLIIINYHLSVIELCCEIRLCSVRRSLFTNIYKYDVIMTSSAAMNI